MAKDEYYQLTKEDISKLVGEELPDKAVMSLINANLAVPVNVALAANTLSDHSAAVAQATQMGDIGQST